MHRYSAEFMQIWELEFYTHMNKTFIYENLRFLTSVRFRVLPPCVKPPKKELPGVRYAFHRKQAMEYILAKDFRARLEACIEWIRIQKARRRATREALYRGKITADSVEREDTYFSSIPTMLTTYPHELEQIIHEYPDALKTNLSALLLAWFIANTRVDQTNRVQHVNVFRVIDTWLTADFSERHKYLKNKFLKDALFPVSVDYRVKSSPEWDTVNIEGELRSSREGSVLLLPLNTYSKETNAGIAKLCRATTLPNGSSRDPAFINRAAPPTKNITLDETIKNLPEDELWAAYRHLQEICYLPVEGIEYSKHRLQPEILDMIARFNRLHPYIIQEIKNAKR